MNDIGFGLWMAAAGMGTVFAILLLLTGALWLIGRSDVRTQRRRRLEADAAAAELEAAPADEPHVVVTAGGLSPDELAAIAVAVITHAQVRRNQAAPAMRRDQPGSLLYASRWVASGRSTQTTPWRRS